MKSNRNKLDFAVFGDIFERFNRFFGVRIAIRRAIDGFSVDERRNRRIGQFAERALRNTERWIFFAFGYVHKPRRADIRAVFEEYEMEYPEYQFFDTLRASRQKHPELENHQLQTAAAACGFDLINHHNAIADAEACAAIAIQLL